MRTFDPPFDADFWRSMPKVTPTLFLAKLNSNTDTNLTIEFNNAKILEFSLGNNEAYIIVQHNAALEAWLAITSWASNRRWGIYHTVHYDHNNISYDEDIGWYSPSYFLNGKWEMIDNRNFKIYGDALPQLSNQFTVLSTAADVPFTTIFDDLLSQATIKQVTDNYISQQEWHTWDFEKAGTFKTTDLRNLQQILAKKYLVNVFSRSFDGTAAQLLFQNLYAPTPASSFDYFGNITFSSTQEQDYLSLSYIDESDILTVVDDYSIKHFLGFIPSTADVTELTQSSFIYDPKINIENCYDPRLENGDFIKLDFPSNMPGNSTVRVAFIEVIETFNDKGLRTIIKSVRIVDGVNKTANYKTTNQVTAMKMRIETDQFNGILSASDNNIQAAIETIDDHDHSTTYAPIAKGVTNGDNHDHSGGDGAQIAYSSLSGTPTAEANSNDIFRVDNPGSVSLWTGTISGAPSGASVTVSAPASGTEAVLVPTSTSQLAKMRLYNLTRGDSALISNYNTGTNVVTLTTNAPGAWANGDSLTIVSQTVSGGGFDWIDLEITSGPTGKSSIFAFSTMLPGTVGDTLRVHPFETFGAGKVQAVTGQVIGTTSNSLMLIKVASNVFSITWSANTATMLLREAGYLE